MYVCIPIYITIHTQRKMQRGRLQDEDGLDGLDWTGLDRPMPIPTAYIIFADVKVDDTGTHASVGQLLTTPE